MGLLSAVSDLRNVSLSGTLVYWCYPSYCLLNQKLPYCFANCLQFKISDCRFSNNCIPIYLSKQIFIVLQQCLSASSQPLNLIQKIPTHVTPEGGNNINFNNAWESRWKNIQEIFRVDRAQGAADELQGPVCIPCTLDYKQQSETCKTVSNNTISLGNWSLFFSNYSNLCGFILSWSKTQTANHANSNWTAFIFLHKLKGLVSTLHCNFLR